VEELADVTVAAADEEWLAAFTRRLVKDGLAAGGHIVPRVRSIYSWDGGVEDESEALVILHTRKSLVPAVIQRAKEEHPYDVPQVIALPVTDANPDYVDWLLTATRSKTDASR
jgi:periplasmic divalent cation tolerance protein